jgi:GxxExxY protein
MNENVLSEKVIGLALKVHTTLGPGLLESVYEKALSHELKKAGFSIEVQKPIAVIYDGLIIDEGYRADIVVEDRIILELKSIKQIEDIHLKQLLTYIKLTKIKLGILINLNELSLKNGIKRVINGII